VNCARWDLCGGRSVMGVSTAIASADEMLVCGMALGYADRFNPVNAFHTPRVAVNQFTKWLD